MTEVWQKDLVRDNKRILYLNPEILKRLCITCPYGFPQCFLRICPIFMFCFECSNLAGVSDVVEVVVDMVANMEVDIVADRVVPKMMNEVTTD